MGGNAVVRKEAIGPLLGIMPWNFPYYQVARFAAPNLMVGNTILLKHAPQCPESALAIEQIFADAGLPADAYINLFATNDQSADIIADPRLVGVSVTGCERAGSAVAEVAGRHLKKVVLELGGSDPFILLDADDLGAAVKSAVRGRMGNAGQACNGAKRMIVVDELYDDFVEQFTAAMSAPRRPATRSTQPPASVRCRRSRPRRTCSSRSRTPSRRAPRCAPAASGSTGPGAFVEATVLTDVTPDMRAYSEELFGPAAVVYRVADADEAVALANDSSFGLGGVVWSSDTEQAQQVADHARHRHGVDQQRPGLGRRPARSVARSAPASVASSAPTASTSS